MPHVHVGKQARLSGFGILAAVADDLLPCGSGANRVVKHRCATACHRVRHLGRSEISRTGTGQSSGDVFGNARIPAIPEFRKLQVLGSNPSVGSGDLNEEAGRETGFLH